MEIPWLNIYDETRFKNTRISNAIFSNNKWYLELGKSYQFETYLYNIKHYATIADESPVSSATGCEIYLGTDDNPKEKFQFTSNVYNGRISGTIRADKTTYTKIYVLFPGDSYYDSATLSIPIKVIGIAEKKPETNINFKIDLTVVPLRNGYINYTVTITNKGDSTDIKYKLTDNHTRIIEHEEISLNKNEKRNFSQSIQLSPGHHVITASVTAIRGINEITKNATESVYVEKPKKIKKQPVTVPSESPEKKTTIPSDNTFNNGSDTRNTKTEPGENNTVDNTEKADRMQKITETLGKLLPGIAAIIIALAVFFLYRKQ